MNGIVQNLWLIPVLPILAAGVIAVLKQRHRTLAASLAIGSMALSFLLSVIAFVHLLSLGNAAKQAVNIPWFQVGDTWFRIGWILDPLTIVMLLMVTFVATLIFIYSVGYMHDDENFTRFFCFLALFAGAMLGVLIANNLLLLFMCWEIVGLTSYLLIGFWYAKPAAAAAAKKAFLVTRIGDIGFFLGMVWLYAQTGTLLFYDNGAGALEHSALATLVAHTTLYGMTVSTGIGLLIFCGAAGKSGQVPLHVWLPDAMEGPTPVSALIHAATMVAAGVFLVARVYPLMSAHAPSLPTLTPSIALQVITWIGAITALFGALIAIAQFDVKRILAYSTVSQLGYMMMGLGVGGVSVGMFHLLTHAFFKALLFLGAGSIIHGCHGEQDIRHMGGLKRHMRITFYTYAIGMLALCGFPLFSGFFSKDEILHAAFSWSISRGPFFMGAFGAVLTAFYMTRQLCYMFFGESRRETAYDDEHRHGHAHESPAIMTTPLILLAACTLAFSFLGAPSWRWIQSFLDQAPVHLEGAAPWLGEGVLQLMLASSVLVFLGIGLGILLYHRRPIRHHQQIDALEKLQPHLFRTLQNAFYIDKLYAATIVRLNNAFATTSDLLDRWLWSGLVTTISSLVVALAWLDNFIDTYLVNGTFDAGTQTVSLSGRLLALLQGGRIQSYLRIVGLAFIAMVVLLLWRAKA
jgi:NADH-quinone oxidoreductase subunit L